jgi:hypothetical protein
VNTTAQIGGALGLAVLATVATSTTNTLLAQHTPAAAALTSGYHLAFWIACALVITAAAIAATTLHQHPTPPPLTQPQPELAAARQTD